jgi:hypothetical protein
MTGMGLLYIMILKCLSFDLDVYKCEMCMIHVACRNVCRSLVGNVKGRDRFGGRV